MRPFHFEALSSFSESSLQRNEFCHVSPVHGLEHVQDEEMTYARKGCL